MDCAGTWYGVASKQDCPVRLDGVLIARHTGSGTSSEYVVVRSSSSLRAACVGAWVWDGRMAKEVRVVEIHTTYSVQVLTNYY